MPAVTLPVPQTAIEHSRPNLSPVTLTLYRTLILGALSTIVFFVHGYHPYSQDAGIYVAAIEKALNPSLFHADAAFVSNHAHFSIFSYTLAAIVRTFHISLNDLLLGAYLSSVILFLVACRCLAVRLFTSEWDQWGALLLLSACYTLPVAGTSVLLMDPYVTARSFAMPMSILAICGYLDRSWMRLAILVALTLSLHVLIGAYLVCFLLILTVLDQGGWGITVVFCVYGLAGCGWIFWIGRKGTDSVAYEAVLKTHEYLFLSGWHWYEVLGVVLPVVIMGYAANQFGLHSPFGRLAAACAMLGGASYLASILYVHLSHPDFLVRVQLLRSFHIIYCLGALMLGGFLFSRTRGRTSWVAFACVVLAFVGMAIAENQSYLESSRIELPDMTETNPWTQAFLWIRRSTPQNALFAAAPSELTVQDEDAQSFRAIAERSILDGVKDEGLASIFPGLAEDWFKYHNAEHGLNRMSDTKRFSQLHAYGVTWILLSPKAKTNFPCPYRNSVLAVCKLTRKHSSSQLADAGKGSAIPQKE